MKEWLETHFHVRSSAISGNSVSILHNRPLEFSRFTNLNAKHEIMKRLAPEFKIAYRGSSSFNTMVLRGDSTLFTQLIVTKDGTPKVVDLKHRPQFLVSSTSWMAEDDFPILLDALGKLDTIRESAGWFLHRRLHLCRNLRSHHCVYSN